MYFNLEVAYFILLSHNMPFDPCFSVKMLLRASFGQEYIVVSSETTAQVSYS